MINAKTLKSQIAAGQIDRAKLLDEAYYNRLVALLSVEDDVEAKESWKKRREMKEARETQIWWLGVMRNKAYREYLAQKNS